MKIAKIALSADTAKFKAEIEDAKKILSGIGQAKIAPDASKAIANIFSEKLKGSARQIQSQIDSISKRLENMARSDAFDSSKAERYGRALESLKGKLTEINTMQDKLSKGQFPTPPSAPTGAPSGFLGGMGRAALGIATSVGIGALYNRREQMADERLKIRQLTRDGQSIGESSAMGFTPAERRARALELARGAGGGTSAASLETLTNLAETAERAYGIQGEQSAGLVGAARKAGVQDQGKFLSNSIGAAVATGLEGSQIGEYLSAMSGYIGEMSRGINIDGNSLNGFAAALGGLPFFKNDPNRIFDALKSLDQSFKNGDAFQQAQATRGILASAPGASPAATEFRRKMGLFGELDKDTMANLKAAGVDTKALGVGGNKIVRNIFDDVMKSTSGMSADEQLYEFQARTGMEAGPAASIFGGLKTGKMSSKEIEEKLREASMSPEERLAKTMENADGQAKRNAALLSQIYERMATHVADPINKLAASLDKLLSMFGVDTVAAGGAVGAAGVAAGAAASLGAGKLLSKAAPAIGKGAGRLGTAAAKGGLGGMGKALGRMGGKGISRLIPGVGLLMAGKDAWDVYDKYQRGEEITPKDWAVLSTSALAGVAGLVPGVGTGVAAGLTAASVGAEFLPDDIGKSGSMPSGMPTDGMDNVLPFTGKKAESVAPSQAASTLGGTAGLEAALRENTAATMQNTMVSSMNRSMGGGGSRLPSNAQQIPAGQIRTGKR